MRKILFILFISIISSASAIEFDAWFVPGSLRIDYIHAGTSGEEYIAIHNIIKEPHWGGGMNGLITPFGYGKYKFEVFDAESNSLIYSNGFSSLFAEWQTTDEADQMTRAFEESLCMPYPKKNVRIDISSRDKNLQWKLIYTLMLDPADKAIKNRQTTEFPYKKIHDAGPPSEKLDVVFLAEGYSHKEMKKFSGDVERFKEYLFGCEPFMRHKDNINLWAVFSVSEESGTDLPGDSIWKKTVMNSHFYTFGSERYLTVPSQWKMRDIAANVPYDQAVVIVNSSKYGGGGVYNYFTVATSDHKNADFLFVHEFGHALAGLADEYYTSDVSYDGFYSLEVEPWEENITTLIDFDSKWKSMIDEGIPVPTPSTIEFKEQLGAFEGGGYIPKGIYRPKQDCTMKSVRYNDFCPVCRKTLEKVIKWYSE